MHPALSPNVAIERTRLSRAVVQQVCARGLASPQDARGWILSVLRALGTMLTAEERRSFASVLPAPWVHALDAGPRAPTAGVEELYRACDDGSLPGRARERAQIVCAAFGARLPRDARERLARALPPDVACLLEVEEAFEMAPKPERPRGHTLATGGPGSRHPIAESAPPGAQHHSVAEANPHGDTKVASAIGSTQERLHDTLADATPIDERTIANATG